jgi:MFS transporter, ACS family, hexuronate transporter
VAERPVRWNIAVLISAAIAISYFDRQTLPVTIRAIQLDISISNTQAGRFRGAMGGVVLA